MGYFRDPLLPRKNSKLQESSLNVQVRKLWIFRQFQSLKGRGPFHKRATFSSRCEGVERSIQSMLKRMNLYSECGRNCASLQSCPLPVFWPAVPYSDFPRTNWSTPFADSLSKPGQPPLPCEKSFLKRTSRSFSMGFFYSISPRERRPPMKSLLGR